MTIQDAKRAHAQLELAIEKLLSDFGEQTDIKVIDLSVEDRGMFMGKQRPFYRVSVGTSLE